MGDRIKVVLGRYADPRYLKWVLFLLSLIALFASATPALADRPTPDNLNVQVGRVEIFERIIWTKPPTSDDMSVAPNPCKTYVLGVRGYSPAGVPIWEYQWTIQWCYNGTTITWVNKYRTVWTNIGWTFKGDIAESQSGGVGNWLYSHYAQGDFCFFELPWTCVFHVYPWVNQIVYGNGNYAGNVGW